MGVLLLMLGCAKHVSWDVQPRPSYELPGLEVSVVAGERPCKRVADDLAKTLSARPGVVVKPDAPVRLLVQDCEQEIDTIVELEQNFPGIVYGTNVFQERRRYDMRGWANAVLIVDSPAAPTVRLAGGSERRVRGPWISDGELDMPRVFTLQQAVRRDLATDLADQLAPLPATIRRTLYPDPEPGTSRQLHNLAVDAEREGELDEALRLAKEAYAANPTASGMDYIEALQDHAAAVGYALRP
ncbi:MAG: hypothetical protein Q8P41_11520 [Pseudomonadota bacterium]|nr:hypothetical protein [Pseudomonadota bacterium]